LLVLIGYKEALATHEVREWLRANGRPNTAEAVATWCQAIKFSEAAPSRVTAKQDIINSLDELESLYGKRHPLATIVNLDAACQKTSCKNGALQDKLLAPRPLLVRFSDQRCN
jgi:hypothetical protein